LTIKTNLIKLLTFLLPLFALAQTASVNGVILSEGEFPIQAVNIKTETTGTSTNENGFYKLTVPSNTDVTIVYSHVSHKNVTVTLIQF
jgi:thiamine biosynthesis protein ThiC